MFDVTPGDIATLSDEDLRTLVGLLCESELASHQYSRSYVTWGGNQTAADGGVDVRISLPDTAQIEGFVPRPVTVYQVKKQDMPRSEIGSEMRPRGSPRPLFAQLAAERGAYIIVSSEGSTADTALTDRRDAMRSSIADIPNSQDMYLDFFDRTRIASWVRTFPGLVIWVREKIGRTLAGWKPYGSWAYDPEGENNQYILDDGPRLFRSFDEKSGLTALQAINDIRAQLAQPRSVIRLVGLSGVGKTRFVQALFDSRVGDAALEPELAVYCNVADDPAPTPLQMVTDLIANQGRAVVIIDNCPPNLHRSLSEVSRGQASTVSLLTVEYDIHEDQPEGTEVYELYGSSDELIEQLIRRRFPELTSLDAATIAKFSGGNARVAISLASAVERGESVIRLTDEELFQRLFRQRQQSDDMLLRAAQASSLVYSFDGEDVTSNPESELSKLGVLAGMPALEMYRHVAELQRRDLVQARGVWRAVLPHAFANRLANVALDSLPPAAIRDFIEAAPERLLRSFSRRLGYLANNSTAQRVVRHWLNENGLLADVRNLSKLGADMLCNIGPVDPAAALDAIERAFLKEPDSSLDNFERYGHLLRAFAYDPTLFERSAILLARLAIYSLSKNSNHNNRDNFSSMFQLCLSGTHASVDQRLKIINELLHSNSEQEQQLGLSALDSACEAWRFQSFLQFDFGGLRRDYGYWPTTQEEASAWFTAVLQQAEQFALADTPVGRAVRDTISSNFRGLWIKAQVYEDLERVCSSVRAKTFWPEGWLAVRMTLRYDADPADTANLARLKKLEAILRPTDLIENVRALVLGNRRGSGLDLLDVGDDNPAERYSKLEQRAQDLGQTVANDRVLLDQLIFDVITATEGRIWSFGMGLARGAENIRSTWDYICKHFIDISDAQRRVDLLQGFLRELSIHQREKAEELLDEVASNKDFVAWSPALEAAIQISERGASRLHAVLTSGAAPILRFRALIGGDSTASLPAESLANLTREIAKHEGGFEVAADIVWMRLHHEHTAVDRHEQATLAAGRDILKHVVLGKHHQHLDHVLGELSKNCLAGENNAQMVRDFCLRLRTAIENYSTHATYHDDLVVGLFSANPIAALDVFFDGNEKHVNTVIHQFRDYRRNPLALIPDEILVSWCNENPAVRYPLMAAAVIISPNLEGEGQRGWTSIGLQLFQHAPEPSNILDIYADRMRPTTWSGSRASVMETNVALLDELPGIEPDLKKHLEVLKSSLRQQIEYERRRERIEDRRNNERFE